MLIDFQEMSIRRFYFYSLGREHLTFDERKTSALLIYVVETGNPLKLYHS
jgi:hypothetical protein